ARLGCGSLARNFALGNDRVSAARLCSRRSQCDARCGRGPDRSTGSQAMNAPAHLKRPCRPVATRTSGRMDPIHQFAIKNLLPIFRIATTEIALTSSALFLLLGL